MSDKEDAPNMIEAVSYMMKAMELVKPDVDKHADTISKMLNGMADIRAEIHDMSDTISHHTDRHNSIHDRVDSLEKLAEKIDVRVINNMYSRFGLIEDRLDVIHNRLDIIEKNLSGVDDDDIKSVEKNTKECMALLSHRLDIISDRVQALETARKKDLLSTSVLDGRVTEQGKKLDIVFTQIKELHNTIKSVNKDITNMKFDTALKSAATYDKREVAHLRQEIFHLSDVLDDAKNGINISYTLPITKLRYHVSHIFQMFRAILDGLNKEHIVGDVTAKVMEDKLKEYESAFEESMKLEVKKDE